MVAQNDDKLKTDLLSAEDKKKRDEMILFGKDSKKDSKKDEDSEPIEQNNESGESQSPWDRTELGSVQLHEQSSFFSEPKLWKRWEALETTVSLSFFFEETAG